jgi:hypothetical protein
MQPDLYEVEEWKLFTALFLLRKHPGIVSNAGDDLSLLVDCPDWVLPVLLALIITTCIGGRFFSVLFALWNFINSAFPRHDIRFVIGMARGFHSLLIIKYHMISTIEIEITSFKFLGPCKLWILLYIHETEVAIEGTEPTSLDLVCELIDLLRIIGSLTDILEVLLHSFQISLGPFEHLFILNFPVFEIPQSSVGSEDEGFKKNAHCWRTELPFGDILVTNVVHPMPVWLAYELRSATVDRRRTVS